VRKVVTHRISFGILPIEGAGQNRDLRKSATFSVVRRSHGVSRTSGANGARNGGSYHGGSQRGLLSEVKLGEENIPETNMRPHGSLKPHQEVVTMVAGFPRRRAKL